MTVSTTSYTVHGGQRCWPVKGVDRSTYFIVTMYHIHSQGVVIIFGVHYTPIRPNDGHIEEVEERSFLAKA